MDLVGTVKDRCMHRKECTRAVLMLRMVVVEITLNSQEWHIRECQWARLRLVVVVVHRSQGRLSLKSHDGRDTVVAIGVVVAMAVIDIDDEREVWRL